MSVFRFYSDPKDGVTYKPSVTPLLTREEIRKRRVFSNFYRSPDFSFEYGGSYWDNTEVPFQYFRWIRPIASEDATILAARLEFAKHIQNAATPAKAYFLQSFVKYRKRDGVAYCSAPFPSFRPYAELVMSAYNKGVRRPEMDEMADVELMFALNMAKYGQNKTLLAQLHQTGTATLVEHTTRDRRWGDGGDGTGHNLLGHVLMRVRDAL